MDKVLDKRQGEHIKVESYSETTSSPTRIPGPVRFEIDAQDAYGLGFGRYLYGWKDNDETFPVPPVPLPNSSRVIRNRPNKLGDRNYFGAAPPFGPIGPCTELSPVGTRL